MFLSISLGTSFLPATVPNSGWKFTSWSGDVQSTNEITEVQVTAELNVTAEFDPEDTTTKQYAIEAAKDNEFKILAYSQNIFFAGTPSNGSHVRNINEL